jgi:hypothetical protein
MNKELNPTATSVGLLRGPSTLQTQCGVELSPLSCGVLMNRAASNNRPGHRAESNAQTRFNSTARQRPVQASFSLATSSNPTRLPANEPFAKPVLTGDRHLLRALRAAEMAAWEAARPSTTEPSSTASSAPPMRRVRLPVPVEEVREALFLVILVACAVTAVVIGLKDVANLFASWAQVARGIQQLLQ